MWEKKVSPALFSPQKSFQTLQTLSSFSPFTRRAVDFAFFDR
jgi:hypothetical protein